jgi:hypothetical protein
VSLFLADRKPLRLDREMYDQNMKWNFQGEWHYIRPVPFADEFTKTLPRPFFYIEKLMVGAGIEILPANYSCISDRSGFSPDFLNPI